MICLVLGVSSAWATDYSNAIHSFASNSLATGLSTNGTFTSSYYKMNSGDYAEITAAKLFGEEALSTDMTVNVACGTFGTWSGTKTLKLTAAFLDSGDNVLSSQEFTTGGLNNSQGTYRGEFTLSKPTNVANISKLRVTFSDFTSGEAARLAGIKLTYSTKSAEPLATYTLTITQPTEGGTLTVKNGSTTLSNGASVEVGTKLTCEVTNIPEGKRFCRFYINYDGGKSIYKAKNPSTFDNIPTEGITAAEVTVTYLDLGQFTINYMVDGVNTNAQVNVWEGTVLVFPTPTAIGDKTFIGWSETAIDGTTDDAPSFVNIDGLIASEDKTYYAVFADLTPGDFTTTTDVLSRETTGVENGATTYSAWSNKTATSDAVYAGKSAGGNNSIQLRNNSTASTKSYDGIITTTSGGKAKKVVVEWNSNTVVGRTLNVYGKNTAYSTIQEIFGENKGTLLGTIVMGTSTTLNISGDYEYLAFASNSGAMYITSISIDWENGTPDTYSNYCTTVTSPIIANITITSAGYTTYFNEFAYVMPEGLEGKVMKVSDNGVASETAFEAEEIVPANTALVLKGEAKTYDLVGTDSEGTAVEGNLLQGSTTALDAASVANKFGAGKYYKLVNEDNGIGWYWGAENGSAFAFKANKAYLVVPESQASNIRYISIDGDSTTGIDAIDAATESFEIYNLQGQRISRLQKGVNIVNNRKVIRY